MADLKTVARLTRWAAGSMAFNLSKIPEDKLDWKPTPESKSALDVVGEVIFVMKAGMPIFTGGTIDFGGERAKPAGRAEALQGLREAAEAQAAALDAAGDELERAIETPMGPLWGAHAVTFGLVDLIHHHGQITYIQSLLGDAENHMEMDALAQYFGPPAA
ncbi:MAG: DinB family [Armatimonadetes bacterium]|nr:DinB family [Armatimonadota bacterium]